MTCGGSRPFWVKGKAVAVGRDSDSIQRFRRGSGVGMPGRGDRPKHGKPQRREVVALNENSVRSRLGRLGVAPAALIRKYRKLGLTNDENASKVGIRIDHFQGPRDSATRDPESAMRTSIPMKRYCVSPGGPVAINNKPPLTTPMAVVPNIHATTSK